MGQREGGIRRHSVRFSSEHTNTEGRQRPETLASTVGPVLLTVRHLLEQPLLHQSVEIHVLRGRTQPDPPVRSFFNGLRDLVAVERFLRDGEKDVELAG